MYQLVTQRYRSDKTKQIRPFLKKPFYHCLLLMEIVINFCFKTLYTPVTFHLINHGAWLIEFFLTHTCMPFYYSSLIEIILVLTVQYFVQVEKHFAFINFSVNILSPNLVWSKFMSGCFGLALLWVKAAQAQKCAWIKNGSSWFLNVFTFYAPKGGI